MSFCRLASEISTEPGGGVASAAGVPAACPLLPDGFAAESFLLSDLHEAKERAARAARERSRRFIGFIYEGGEDRRPRRRTFKQSRVPSGKAGRMVCPSERVRGSQRDSSGSSVTTTSPVSVRWTGHLCAISRRRALCSSVRAPSS